jgi:hypothetical protein
MVFARVMETLEEHGPGRLLPDDGIRRFMLGIERTLRQHIELSAVMGFFLGDGDMAEMFLHPRRHVDGQRRIFKRTPRFL